MKKKRAAGNALFTSVQPGQHLPLTCSRRGICCHNKAVWLNPWELHQLAQAAGLETRIFRDRHTVGGVRLCMDGPVGWRGYAACCLYDPLAGCRAHAGRPLACRLYPLGRRQSTDAVSYVYEGSEFPCLDGCPEVEGLPQLTLEEYLATQDTAQALAAQQAYLEVMQDLAEGALVLLLDSGLAASGDRETLPLWRSLGALLPEERAERLSQEWYDRLTLVATDTATDAIEFAKQHCGCLQQNAQKDFAGLNTVNALRSASGVMMALALQLGAGLGIDPKELVAQWCESARANGARD